MTIHESDSLRPSEIPIDDAIRAFREAEREGDRWSSPPVVHNGDFTPESGMERALLGGGTPMDKTPTKRASTIRPVTGLTRGDSELDTGEIPLAHLPPQLPTSSEASLGRIATQISPARAGNVKFTARPSASGGQWYETGEGAVPPVFEHRRPEDDDRPGYRQRWV